MNESQVRSWSERVALKLSQLGLQIDEDGQTWNDIQKMAAYLRAVAQPRLDVHDGGRKERSQ